MNSTHTYKYNLPSITTNELTVKSQLPLNVRNSRFVCDTPLVIMIYFLFVLLYI